MDSPRFLTCGVVLYLTTVIYYWKQIFNNYQEIDNVLINYGKNVEGASGRMKGYHNRKIFHNPNMIEGSTTWKQNIRK